jgi:hypothetical protein
MEDSASFVTVSTLGGFEGVGHSMQLVGLCGGIKTGWAGLGGGGGGTESQYTHLSSHVETKNLSSILSLTS